MSIIEKFRSGLRMKNKIRIILIGLCMTILIAFIAASYFYTRENIIDLVTNKYWELALKQFEFIEYWMERRVENTEKIAKSESVIYAVKQSYYDGKIEKRRMTALKDYVRGVLYDQEVYIKITVVSRDGKICYSTDGSSGNIADGEIFKEIAKTDDVHVCRVKIEKHGGKERISQPVCYPVFESPGEKGEVTGYIITHINLDILDDSISMIDLGEKGNAYLVNKDGKVICSTGDYEYERDESGYPVYQLLNPGTENLTEGIDKCFKTNHAGNETYLNHQGIEVIGVWKWYSYFEWVFLIEVDRDIALERVARIMVIFLIIAFIFSIAAVLLSVYLSRRIVDPINKLSARMKDIAEGDGDLRMKLDFHSRDELGDVAASFNEFIDKVGGTISDVKEVSGQLAYSSSEMSSTLSNFSENAQNQAASAEEITATVEEVSAGVDNVADGAELQDSKMTSLMARINELSTVINEMSDMIKEASSLSGKILEQVQAGDKVLNQMNNSMTKISDSSGEITNIVNIISDISDQINLLSLNAAIEAARAGDAGRGFAVVADEISKLADETSGSIKNIDTLVKENENEITVGRNNVVETVKGIGLIIDGVNSIGDMMSKIFESMQKQIEANEVVNEEADQVKARSNEIMTAMSEQKIAVNEIVRSISSMSNLITSSAAGTEQLSANAKHITEMADSLKDKVDFFKV